MNPSNYSKPQINSNAKPRTVLKLGTRKSLLALAQSQWVARRVEQMHPTVSVELVGMVTQGDKIQNIPLSKVQGKEFFTAELDTALLDGTVDFNVHSLKDLSLTRPPQFACAAIPKRENPRDVIVFSPHAFERLQGGEQLLIGTSSPRRIRNIPDFLERVLPKSATTSNSNASTKSRTTFVEIRGNVNTRVSRVKEPLNSERYLDGVVLAFAGLIRLWADVNAHSEIKQLLQGTRWMVLPLQECPTAPGQAALAIECRSDDHRTLEILKHLNEPQTEREVKRERDLLKEWGGGCHQKFGATVIQSSEFDSLFYVRGEIPDGTTVEELRWSKPASKSVPSNLAETKIVSWDGTLVKSTATDLAPSQLFETKTVFVAHSRAVNSPKLIAALRAPHVRVWTSGVTSWRKLAEKGIWVEGCAEGLGFETFKTTTLTESLLELPGLESWMVLTHQDAISDWTSQKIAVLPTYRIHFDYPSTTREALKAATHVFWSSGSQYDELKENVSNLAHHACGPGKTAAYLRNSGISPAVFPTPEEWRKWIQEITSL